MTHQQYRLGSLLIEKNLISAEQLEEAIAIQRLSAGEQLGKILIEHHYLTERQLRRTLRYQSRLRKVACVLALTLAPMQMVAAKDFGDNPNLYKPVWDNTHGVESFNFDSQVVDVDLEELIYAKDYLPLCLSIDDVKAIYSLFTGSDQPTPVQKLTEHQVETLRYNFEVNASGGMRLNLQYRF